MMHPAITGTLMSVHLRSEVMFRENRVIDAIMKVNGRSFQNMSIRGLLIIVSVSDQAFFFMT